MSVLILDGVTGAGKSSVLAALATCARVEALGTRYVVIPEDVTLGTLMDDLREPAWRRSPHFPSLERVLADIEAAARAPEERYIVVERFHTTFFALFPEWERYEDCDARLVALGARQVLLSYPEHQIEARSLDRADREGEGWAAGMAAWYGSREGAIEAVRESRRLREVALSRSALPFLHLDTRDLDFRRVAAAIAGWWLGGEPT